MVARKQLGALASFVSVSILTFALALAPLVACKRGGEVVTPFDAGTGGDGSAAADGPARAVDAGLWSCGSAAGVCTCVRIGVDPGAFAHGCAASDCCFVDDDGACSCRLPSATLDCAALIASLRGTARVPACGAK
jgi:hypothetical protein